MVEEAQQSGTERLPLEILLIGTLWVLNGVVTAILTPLPLRQMLARGFSFAGWPTGLTSLGLVEVGISYVLALAGIVVGIGLLHYAVWARRDAVILLFFMIAAWVVSRAITVVGGQMAPPHFGRAWVLPAVLFSLCTLVPYLAYLLCLESPRIRALWQDDARPGRMASWAAAVWQHMPTHLTPVAALIGILLLCRALPETAGTWTRPSTFGAGVAMLQIGEWLGAIGYLLQACWGPLLLIAAVLLFTRVRWAYLVGVAGLCVAILSAVWPYIYHPGHGLPLPTNNASNAISVVLVVASGMLRNGIMAVVLFVARPAPPVAVSPSEVALDVPYPG